MNNCIHKLVCFLTLITAVVSSKCNAQDIYKGNPWMLQYGFNLIIEDGNQFTRFVNNEKIIWNASPFTFGVEKRQKNGLGFQATIGTNIYPNQQKIKGITLEKPKDVVLFDFKVKYNFNSILQDTSKFDPYFAIGPGYIFKGDIGQLTTNICFGFNRWIAKSPFSIGLEGIYKVKMSNFDNYGKDNTFQINLMLIHLID